MSENPKPFIPSWLDEAGLSQQEFRIYCHLCRRADNATGTAWPSYSAMIETCGSSKMTIRRSLGILEERGLIVKLGKPFGGSCRYQVLSAMIPPQGQMEAANSTTTGTIEAAPIVPPQDRNSTTTLPSIVPPEGQEGTPKKVIHLRKSKREVSSDGIQFAQWFKSTLPPTVNLKANWQESFAKEYDDLERIDKRSPEQIMAVCQWARADSFWQAQFMSPAKLRDRNSSGIQYFDVFSAKMKAPSGPTSKTQPSTVNTGRRTAPTPNL
jgi:hypothetical protein